MSKLDLQKYTYQDKSAENINIPQLELQEYKCQHKQEYKCQYKSAKNINMPKLELQEYKCQHKNVNVLDNSIKYKKCKSNCDSCYNYPIHNHQITYQKGICNDCPKKFIIKTNIMIPKKKSDFNFTTPSPSFTFINIEKCHHPQEALIINEDTIKQISSWWLLWWFSIKSNEAWVNASGECLLCDSKIYARRKCIGSMNNNKQMQIWSNWLV